MINKRLRGAAAENVLRQERQFVLEAIAKRVSGHVLGIGLPCADAICALDGRFRSLTLVNRRECRGELPQEHPHVEFHTSDFPPFPRWEQARFDWVVCYEQLEKVRDDFEMMREMNRMLRPDGKILIVTANRRRTLVRNPFHMREYTADELQNLLSCLFGDIEAQSVCGNRKVMMYYEYNRRGVESFVGFDFLQFHRWLPSWLLKIPYAFFNRLNRRRLLIMHRKLTTSITPDDFMLRPADDDGFELFFTAVKQAHP